MMKRYLLLLAIAFLFLSSNVFAAPQKDTVITIDHLPPYIGYLLDKGWKFRAGDDPAFARIDYDDSNWQSINPAIKRPLLPKAAQRGIGWLRVHFKVAPSLRQKILLHAFPSTAIEIYLDGQLIGSRGTIDPGLKTGRGYFNPDPIELSLVDDSVHVLAIRYAHQANIQFINGYQFNPFLSLFFTDTLKLIQLGVVFESYHAVTVICVSILLILALLHFVFLYYNPHKKANLYFACYAFFLAIFAFVLFSTSYRHGYNDIFLYASVLDTIVLIGGELWAIKALYTLFHFKQGKFYTGLIIISAACILTNIFIESPAYLTFIAIFLTMVVQLWLALKGVYLKKRGALIIAAGYLGGLAGFCYSAYLAIYVSVNDERFFLIGTIVLAVAILSPAFGMSLFLSREFALDGQLLAVKLNQVEQLSAANLAQEKEKQQILADQNIILEQQVTERTAELNQSLTHLKATQTQLIQSEKMASLGELTAGIAHEIQNPLNFVNNFSELNTELVEDIKLEIEKGDLAEIKAIAVDIEENSKKINMHGKRAEAIVKGMLQHSQVGSGTKEPTNINALADEYLRLAYHGLRSKDKDFNAEIVTHFDGKLPKVNAIPQDIGRVLLNLFNNAFYAVNQKQKTAGENYKPEVSVSTSSESGQVVIMVKDNGIGIPDAIKEKIMQPFFTTKPTGEGTGLGLSLTYDMVVKGHGGSITVESIEGEGSEFIIKLPL